jgi:cell division protein FtsB
VCIHVHSRVIITAQTSDGVAPSAAIAGAPKLPARKPQSVWVGRALCFAGCVLAANALIGERGLSETLRARREFRQTVVELSKMQYANAVLAEEVRRLRHDARTIEGVARAELGLIKPGEILVVINTTTPR